MDLSTASHVHESLTEYVSLRMSADMIEAIDRVAAEADCTREAVIREYIGECLPEGWVRRCLPDGRGGVL